MDDSTNGSGTSFLIMQGVMGNNMLLFDHASQPGILHHKYLIVDQAYFSSDPLVLTGSHNWSSTANLRNDENTLIIHSQLQANQFYQEFHNLFNSHGGAVGVSELFDATTNLVVYPNPATTAVGMKMNDVKDENLAVEFLSLDGKVVIEKSVTGQQMEEGVRFENHSLSKGVYVIRTVLAFSPGHSRSGSTLRITNSTASNRKPPVPQAGSKIKSSKSGSIKAVINCRI